MATECRVVVQQSNVLSFDLDRNHLQLVGVAALGINPADL